MLWVLFSPQVRDNFKDDKFKIKTRVVHIDADEATCPSACFASTFQAIMVVSDQMDNKMVEGKMQRVLLSIFANRSTLWNRRRCNGSFNLIPFAKFVDPLTDNSSSFRIRDDRAHMLNVEKRTKQYLSGESFWACILESLFQGLQLDKSTHCAVLDLTPYDATLQKYIVMSNHAATATAPMPTFMSVQPSWYASSEADKENIKRYITEELKMFLKAEVEKGTIKYSALNALSKGPPSLQDVPVLDETKFLHSKPDLEMQVCRLKQDFINKWAEVAVCKNEFAIIVKLWNDIRNPGGDAWKGNKRIASAANITEGPEEYAAPHVPDDTDPRTLAEAQVKNGPPVIIPNKDGMYDHVFFPDTGAYALIVKADTVISDADYLVLIKGTFESGEGAKNIKEDTCLSWHGVNGMDELYAFAHDLKGKSFPKKPSSLLSFIKFLEQNEKVKVTLLMHKMVKDKNTKEWSVTPEKECAFVVKPIDTAKKEKPSDQNAGSYVKVSNLMDNSKIAFFMRWRSV